MTPQDHHDCGEGCDEPGHHAFPGLAAHDVLPSPDGASALPESPAKVVELAAACVRFVTALVSTLSGKASPELAPDYTTDTLSLLDYYVAESRNNIKNRPEALPLTASAVGAYLGEVVRRQHRCWWRTDEEDPATWRIDFEAASLSFYPVQLAQILLQPDDGEEEPWSGFELREDDRDHIAARLAELPPVSAEDYLLPSLRLEVLEIALETLIGKLVDDPYAKQALTPDDYE